ncbi:cytochrome P450 [Mycena belliarum]|uniref:Cytochrome P450 n=1 Tax=Mycena belliarum TaxID=1033014 RepID=A0AAD6U198_9AGAR|nr:cytochrome P450 [Mycena belliae]
MPSPLQLIGSVCASLTAYALLKILRRIYQELTSPTRTLPGPNSSHFLYGNLKEFMEDHDSALAASWIAQYGPTMKFHHLFGRSQMYTVDPKAIHHVLMHTTIYQKSQDQRDALSRIVGPGVLVVEGDVHRQQRKIMNPSFGIPQTRALTEIFVDKSIQLREIWVAEAAKGGGVARIEAISWLSKATLDIIGLAGFNYEINALGARAGDAPDELVEAFEAMFHTEPHGHNVLRFIQSRIPLLRNIPTKTEAIERRSQATIARVGRRLLEQSKREVAESGTFETGRARDLLTLLVHANTSKDVPESQRLSDEDVIAQVPTTTVWGSDISSLSKLPCVHDLSSPTVAEAR